ncbi:MAG: hypothetical protein LBU21_03315, partial [Treponema sp.]|nr:hypothetical protein [Treponema sp.]
MLGLPVSSRAQSPAQAWYRSNAAGIALERVSSRFAALRQPYCLLIEEVDSPVLPPPLLSYYRETWIVERRVLYKDGEESRVQWILRDGGGVSRVVAVFNAGDADADDEPLEETLDATDDADTTVTGADATGADTADTGADATGESGTKFSSGFIELYGANGLIELERQLFDTGEETLVEYQYRQLLSGTRQLLIRADTRRTSTDGEGNEYQEDLYTDYYRYTR